MNTTPVITLGELGLSGKQVYEAKLKMLLEPAHNGEFVAIEPLSQRYFLGKTDTEAILAAQRAMPDSLLYVRRVGYRITHHLGGYGTRNR
jgi:hypothetical protein